MNEWKRSVLLRVEDLCVLWWFLSETGGALRGGIWGTDGFFFSFFIFSFFFFSFSVAKEEYNQFCIQNVVQYFGTGHWRV